MILINLLKSIILVIIFLNSQILDSNYKTDINYNSDKYGRYSLISLEKYSKKSPEIYLKITNLNITFCKDNDLFEIKFLVTFLDLEFHIIKPSDLSLLYNLSIFCNFYTFRGHKNIYSFANIHENRDFYCIEYLKVGNHAKFGIKIYNLSDERKESEYNELFFFTDKIINNQNNNLTIQNNYKFDINYFLKNNILLDKFKSTNENVTSKGENNLFFSYKKPYLYSLKEDISRTKGKWYFKNLYNNYFCFCKGKSCLKIIAYNNNEFQSCKYYFYLSIIDENKNLYPKTHYLFSDFFDDNIEPSDALPIFKEATKKKLKAHYITMSWNIYQQLCPNRKCQNDLKVIYGIRKIDGDVLEKYFELFLKLKAVVTAEKYNDINNFFKNSDYIEYIFLGHGIQFIKSYLYEDYLSPKRYNKMVLPPTKIIFSLALAAGWKNEDIIKITCPKFDNYEIYKKKTKSYIHSESKERSIFVMFTWRYARKGKNVSYLYYDNIYKLLNNKEINEQLLLNNIKLYFCYHHTLKEKQIMNIDNDTNIRFISQNEISILLKNSSLIITDFSSILFDAIVQRKPLILYIPDGLDHNLQDIYTEQYYETIIKIKYGIIDLHEVFFDFNEVVNKIIYYIKNDFDLEKEKLEFYKKFNLTNKGNTRKFINYLETLK